MHSPHNTAGRTYHAPRTEFPFDFNPGAGLYRKSRAELPWNAELISDAAAHYVARCLGAQPVQGEHPIVGQMLDADITLVELSIQIAKARGYHAPANFYTTSDFAGVLANSMRILMNQQYEAAGSLRRICREVPARNYMAITFPSIDVADISEDERTREAGEPGFVQIKTAGGETGQLKRLEKIIGVSDEVIVNDDLAALGLAFSQFATMAARREDRTIGKVLLTNANLSDGRPLFNTTDGNLAASGAVPSVTTVNAGIEVLRRQVTLTGNEANNSGRFLVVAPAQELNALAIVRGITIDQNAARLEVVVNTKFTTQWALLADPAVSPALGFMTLRGGRTFNLSAVRLGTGFAGLGFSLEFIHGVAPLSRIGGYLNLGA